jgi:hypothetical protein
VPQFLEIDITRAHDPAGILIVDEGEQQMFKRRIFMLALVGGNQFTRSAPR